MMKTFLSVFGIAGVCFGAAAFFGLWRNPLAEPREVTLFQSTDMHATLFENERYRSMLSTLAFMLDTGRSPNAVRIDCGDFSSGSGEGVLSGGLWPVRVVNECGYDIIVPGNHEFDFGKDEFCRNLNALRTRHLLAANVTAPSVPALKPWAMLERNGLKLAFIGLLTGATRDYWVCLESDTRVLLEDDWEKAVGKIMPAIMDARPDVIILCCHAGEFTAKAELLRLLRRYPQIDLVLGGHTHETVTGKRVGKASFFMESGAHNGYVGAVKISKRPQTVEYPRITAQLHPLSDRFSVPESFRAALDSWRSVWNEKRPNPFSGVRDLKKIQTLFAEKVVEKLNADCILMRPLKTFPFSENLSRGELYNLFPYPDPWVVLELNRPEIEAILAEQKKEPKRSRLILYGVELENLPKRKRIRVGMESFYAGGAGGHYPVLKKNAAGSNAKLQQTGLLSMTLLTGETPCAH